MALPELLEFIDNSLASIDRNLSKLNEHTWVTYKEQIQIHVENIRKALDESASGEAKREDGERVLCAAIWFKDQPTGKILPRNIDKGIVVCDWRHGNCIDTFVSLCGIRAVEPECGQYEQGFLTNKGNFISREKAAAMAYAAGQINDSKNTFLFSEDLY